MIYHFGLIGYPLQHSFSPRIHQEFLKMQGLQGNYELFPIANDDQKNLEFRKIIQKIKAGDLNGINVTIPHKQNIIPFLDGLTSDAEIIGAVNTLYYSNGQVLGENTDVVGFLRDVSRLIDLNSKGRALIFGAGGAARAVVVGLLKHGWQIDIVARRLERAEQLIEDIQERLGKPTLTHVPLMRAFDLSQLYHLYRDTGETLSLIVNCTPVGMIGQETLQFFPSGIQINSKVRVYDLVYNPSETDFLTQAKQLGLCGLNGMGMLLEQAACSFEIWTGISLKRPLPESIIIH